MDLLANKILFGIIRGVFFVEHLILLSQSVFKKRMTGRHPQLTITTSSSPIGHIQSAIQSMCFANRWATRSAGHWATRFAGRWGRGARGGGSPIA